MGIFKAYDIRGTYPKELNEDIVLKIGRVFADILRKTNPTPAIVVGRDMRLSSPKLAKRLIEGITMQGVDVVDIGMASTPTLYFAVAYFGYDGGIQVSASHNPKEYNGMKIVGKRAYPISENTGLKNIEKRVIKNKFDAVGSKGDISRRNDILAKEVDESLKFCNIGKIHPLKVVVDAANSMGSLYTIALFKKLPCKLIKMNFELDGTFPSHEPDPFKEENLASIKNRVIKEKADIGIAIDGDGDRVFFIDNSGEVVDPAIIRGILSRIFLREYPGAKICYDTRPGQITRDMILENGGVPIVTKVGHSLIKEQAIREGAVFAGESSGHFFVAQEFGMFETPMIVILKLLQEISYSGLSFSDYVKPLKRYYHSGELNFVADDKKGVIAKIKKMFSDGKINEIDGVSVEYDDWWMNIRAANTEPLLRLTIEARTKDKMEEIRDMLIAVIKGY
ncbi:MAG: phosphomannomutase/phosphoglucomutase [Candidatus Aenigmarchaeota archaeon]|nr:phosphomannomutase/phosphoglucomutase [Candidatus Aenigmarchaeota archaeon]